MINLDNEKKRQKTLLKVQFVLLVVSAICALALRSIFGILNFLFVLFLFVTTFKSIKERDREEEDLKSKIWRDEDVLRDLPLLWQS